MTLSHHDVLAIMGIGGVTSVLEKRGEPLTIGILDQSVRRRVEGFLRIQEMEQPVRFVVSRRATALADAERSTAELGSNKPDDQSP